jgi:hypothetical protein
MKTRTRRALIGAVPAALLALTAHAAKLDPRKPEDAIKLDQKMNCSLEEGKTILYWWQGGAYSRKGGEQDKHLFNVQGMNIRQCKNFTDPKRGPGYRSVSREVLIYLDPKTNELLKTWENPWSGEKVQVMHVANDPVNMRQPAYAYSADGKPHTFDGLFMKGRVLTAGEAPLFYKNPLAGEYQEFVGGDYHAMEGLNGYAYESELLDPKLKTLKTYTLSWMRTSKWLPWMKMGDRDGFMVFTTVGKRVASIDDLSEPLRSEIRNTYPAYLAPPPLDDARPNVTSWSYFREQIDKTRAAR